MRNDILLLVQAIEDIQLNWDSGDLAQAVRGAVKTKDEICQRYNFPSTEKLLVDEMDDGLPIDETEGADKFSR